MTNFIKQKFQYFFDMSTSESSITSIKVYAGGPEVVLRTAPFWTAFKYYKLGKIKLKFVPAATLPVDPTGLSIEAGANNSDPRDLFNPGLVRITNGDDIIEIPNDMDEYYAMVLDKRWYKFNLSRGFQRTATPMFWDIAQLKQDNWPGATTNFYDFPAGITNHISLNAITPTSDDLEVPLQATPNGVFDVGSSRYGIFQTGRKIKMGWLPTDYRQNVIGTDGGSIAQTHGINTPPYMPMIDIILPQAFLTRHWYRVYIEEEIMFKDAVAINPVEHSAGYYSQPSDRFVAAQIMNTNLNNANVVQYLAAASDNVGDTEGAYPHKTGDDDV